MAKQSKTEKKALKIRGAICFLFITLYFSQLILDKSQHNLFEFLYQDYLYLSALCLTTYNGQRIYPLVFLFVFGFFLVFLFLYFPVYK